MKQEESLKSSSIQMKKVDNKLKMQDFKKLPQREQLKVMQKFQEKKQKNK